MRSFYLHRLVAEAPQHLQVDHINHDPADNCRGNLRLVTRSQNQQNRRGAERCSVTGHRGVSWVKRDRAYLVTVKVNRKSIRIGQFTCLEDADRAAKQSRKQYMSHASECEVLP